MRKHTDTASEIADVHFEASKLTDAFVRSGLDHFNIAAGLMQLAAHHFIHHGGGPEGYLMLADNSFDVADTIHEEHCCAQSKSAALN